MPRKVAYFRNLSKHMRLVLKKKRLKPYLCKTGFGSLKRDPVLFFSEQLLRRTRKKPRVLIEDLLL